MPKQVVFSYNTPATPPADGNATYPTQPSLFHVERQIEFQDVEMGVLDSGVPYLTGRGLAKMCGIDHKTLHEIAADWQSQKFKPRGKQINQLLEDSGYTEASLYLKADFNGSEVNAYTEPVCLAILEYYAFLAEDKKEQASRAFRILAKTKFREFVYGAVGYSSQGGSLECWKYFHDRVDLTTAAVPDGYFCVFTQVAGMIVAMIRQNSQVDDKTIPDISVGNLWAKHWATNNLDDKYGKRISYSHNYPDYYPQSKSNPQQAYAYPNEAYAEFQEWLKKIYLGKGKFSNYLSGKVKNGQIQHNKANDILVALSSPLIPKAPKSTKALN